MSSETERILKLVAEGKISTAEAELLIDALSKRNAAPAPANEVAPPKKVNYICIKVSSAKKDNVDMRIPLGLLRAGMKFTSLMPSKVTDKVNSAMQEKGIPFNMNNLGKENVEALIQNLSTMQLNVNSQNGDNVQIYCE